MIRSIKAYKVLRGVRGISPVDIEAIKHCILRLSQMVSDHPEIKELDINPLIVYPEGQGGADSRILLTLEESYNPKNERCRECPMKASRAKS